MSNNIIVIPIYKSLPIRFEEISFKQVIKILNKHQFCIVTYDELDISFYINLLRENNIDFRKALFDKSYFENIEGYNRLMLSLDFYNNFANYEYMLIYQLDAYVFRDELDYWCNQGYDYIGAPWIFKNYKRRHPLKTLIFYFQQLYRRLFVTGYDSIAMQERVGNGGFSLRKIQSIVNILKTYENRKVLKNYRNSNSLLEDLFYSYEINRFKRKIKIPLKENAIKFSFETEPVICYELNGYNLPFGCHAWYKNEWFLKKFYSKFIQVK